jgi:hypothetical protein
MMTHIEFSAWLKGIFAATNGEPPTKEVWGMIVQEAAKLANPPGPILPTYPVPGTVEPWPGYPMPWITTCQGVIDSLGWAVQREHP